ncbi:Membrane-bound lytic murein transglycosylase A [Ferriphaselus amnicola]|uniref:peptidoglycan lytic exotransglycosylase n=1 Tax=Ferriphaselus amnicola TaxID=1188319 RepID=A0A2Z6GFA4_9PROT|nr:MltA domain-containing protein [Ferriphaselus amnicola]BBE51924.1 Membrane-bound lytic murein transglycosylase A [Ferriphaselus amnicola]
MNPWLQKSFLIVSVTLLLAACQTKVPPTTRVTASVCPPTEIVAPTKPQPPTYVASRWDQLPDWGSQELAPSWAAFQQSCRGLKNKPNWKAVCDRVWQVETTDNATLRGFFEANFTPYQIINPDGSEQGLITGYYEPRLTGSRTQTERYRFPLYAAPDDLLEIDLTEVYPQLKGMRLRGRLSGKKVVPYFNRADIDAGKPPLKGRELFWVDNAVDLFFLQIQGSGRIAQPDGTLTKVGYADQNGHPYISIGKKLIEMGELKAEQASMQGIKQWGERNPDKLSALLEQNPSYVFFRELPDSLSAPLGALGVPLTNEYSIAIDPRSVPLGSPVFLATTRPNSETPLNRLMLAQDTGGAIKGGVRADFFWGYGDQAGAQAGKMKQKGRMWIFYPNGSVPSVANGSASSMGVN